MADYLPTLPIVPKSKDQLLGELQNGSGDRKALMEGVIPSLTHLVPGLVSSLLSSPKSEGVETFIPNAATGLYSTLDTGQKLIGKALGLPEVSLPGADRATELFEARNDPGSISSYIPKSPARNPTETVLNDAVNAAGSMGVPIPGVSGLPTAARVAIDALLPGAMYKSAPPIAAAITGTVDAATMPEANAAPIDTVAQPSTGNELPTPPAFVPPQMPTETALDLPVPFNPPQTPLADPATGVTWGDVAMYGAGALAIFGGGRKLIRKIAEDANVTREAIYSEKSVPWNQQHANKPAFSGVPEDAAPLPGKAGEVPGRVKGAVADKNTVLDQYTDATAPSKTVAQELRAQHGLTDNDHAFHARFTDTMETGIDPVTGIRFPSPAKVFRSIARLDDTQRTLLDNARHAADELDNRARLLRMGGQLPQTNLQPGQAVHYREFSDAELARMVSAGRADPNVSRVLDDINLQHRNLIRVAENRGMLDSVAAQNILRDHPNYLSDRNLGGTIEHPFSARSLEQQSGERAAYTKSWELDKQHFEKFYRAIEQNEYNANVVQNSYRFQQNQQHAKIFEPSKNAKGEWVKTDDSVAVRINGELQYHKVNNPLILKAMQQSPPLSGAVWGSISAFRNLLQNTVTGPLAAVGGRIFAPINAVRNAIEVPILRPQGTAGGYLDKAVQSISGGKASLPGDPTAIMTMPREIVSGLGGMGARHISNVFEPAATNSLNVKLRAMIGDNAVNAMHQRMQLAWQNSIRAEMRQSGATNVGGLSSTAVPSNYSGADERAYSAINNLVPELFRVDGKLGNAMPFFVRLNEFVKEVQNIVGDAAHTQFYRLNKSNPKLTQRQLAYETRQLTGDPGTHGASEGVGRYMQAAPFANVAIQNMSRLGRAFNESPITTALGISTAVGIPAMYEIFSALLHGPQAIDYLDNMNSSDAAGNIHIFIPGQDPKDAVKVSLPQSIRVFYPVARQMLSDVLSIQAHDKDEDTATWLWNGMRDFFGKHIQQSTVDQAVAGASSFVSPPMPVGVDQAAALMGKSTDITLNSAYNNWDRPIDQWFTRPVSGTPKVPGATSVDPLTGTEGGKIMQQLIADTFGFLGSTAYSVFNTGKNATRDGATIGQAFGNMLEDYKQRAMDSMPFGNATLWNANEKLTSQTPLIARVQDSLEAMKPHGTFSGDIKGEGMTRQRGMQLNSFAPTRLVNDPKMQALQSMIGKDYNFIQSKYMPEILDLKKQQSNLSGSSMPPDELRILRNMYQRDISQRYQEVATIITDLNAHMSKLIGKPVTVDGIDWKRGFDQFED